MPAPLIAVVNSRLSQGAASCQEALFGDFVYRDSNPAPNKLDYRFAAKRKDFR